MMAGCSVYGYQVWRMVLQGSRMDQIPLKSPQESRGFFRLRLHEAESGHIVSVHLNVGPRSKSYEWCSGYFKAKFGLDYRVAMFTFILPCVVL